MSKLSICDIRASSDKWDTHTHCLLQEWKEVLDVILGKASTPYHFHG